MPKKAKKKPARTSKSSGAAKRKTSARASTKASPRARKTTPRKAAKKKREAQSRSVNRAAEARRKRSREAIGLYEKALKALQRRNVSSASDLFQRVLDDFPEERELHERCRRYLEVCRRELTPEPKPQTFEERVYAATLALNAGSPGDALRHLEAALAEQPDSDHVQYMLAVTRAVDGEHSAAVTHLQRAIELNPDNRFLARNEPSFDTLQDEETFQLAVGSPPPAE